MFASYPSTHSGEDYQPFVLNVQHGGFLMQSASCLPIHNISTTVEEYSRNLAVQSPLCALSNSVSNTTDEGFPVHRATIAKKKIYKRQYEAQNKSVKKYIKRKDPESKYGNQCRKCKLYLRDPYNPHIPIPKSYKVKHPDEKARHICPNDWLDWAQQNPEDAKNIKPKSS